jgi:hypothetical protein
MNKKIIIASFAVVIIISISFAYSSSISGNFYKAFTKTVTPNDVINENITIRKYYNMTIRFRYSVDGSDLVFNDSDATIILKDSNNEISRISAVNNGKIYVPKDKLLLDSIKYVDAINLDKFEDVSFQNANITFYGNKAYLTIIVAKKQGSGTLKGYVIDELTSELVDGVSVVMFEKGADTATSMPVSQSISDDGSYSFTIQTDSDGKSYDLYVTDYQVTN